MNRLGFLISVLILSVSGTTARAEIIYGMTAATSASTSPGLALVFFDSATPATLTTVGAFSGLLPGHSLREIDFRPNGGQLYGISTDAAFNAQIYTINQATAALTPQGAPFLLPGTTSAVASMDFNPAADRLRIVTRTGQSYRWNPVTSAFVQADTSAAYVAGDVNTGTPDLVGVAYTNNVPGASTTTLYAWSFTDDSLITIGGLNGTPSPNDGGAFTVFDPTPTFRTFNAGLDMDISGVSGIAFVTHDNPVDGTSMSLFSLNLTTGAETLLGTFPAGTFISSLSATPVPEPGSLALCGLGAAGLFRYIRRRKAK